MQVSHSQINVSGKLQNKPLSRSAVLTEVQWVEMSCYPAAKSVRRMTGNEASRRPGTQNLLNILEEMMITISAPKSINLLRRSAVTSMAYLGYSMIVANNSTSDNNWLDLY